ncbi:MAG: aspartate carbamoyltransferase [Thermoplasmatota archaeon]
MAKRDEVEQAPAPAKRDEVEQAPAPAKRDEVERASFKGRHICHSGDLDVPEMDHVLDVAETLVPAAKGREILDVAHGKVLATLFFEPSTRTRLSFEAAMAILGGATISVAQGDASSAVKGETLADTIRMVAAYADAIVLRHPREGAARLASKFSHIPVINAGDGAGQHPTQTLVDLYTIRKNKGSIAGNRIALVGDLKYGRTVHSLAHALARYGAEIVLVAPPALAMPADTRASLAALGAKVEIAEKLEDVVSDVDVLYVTRIQKERFADIEDYKRVQGTYQVTNALLANGKKSLIVMHPLPRVGEIHPEVDDTPHAKYFEQAANGVPVRMALLQLVMGLQGAGK